jgi:trans-aconitate methyltransferase
MNPHNVGTQDWIKIYAAGGWRGCGSGPGSNLKVNAKLIEYLEKMIVAHQIRSVVDLGCGDLQWMSVIIPQVESYIGIDCVPVVQEQNRAQFPEHEFLVLDVLSQDLPKQTCDLLLCKDLFHHLIPHHKLLLSRIENVNAKFQMIVIPDTPILEKLRYRLESAGWVKEMTYRADEIKLIYVRIR